MYNLLINGLIEYNYKIVINALNKLIKGGYSNWINLLPSVL